MPSRSTSTEASGNLHRAWGRARDGGLAATAAMSVSVLAGVMAFAIDLGRTFGLNKGRMDFAGNSNSLDIWPLTGMSIRDLDFGFSTPPIGNIFPAEFPRCSASLTSEDLRTCEGGGERLSELEI